MKTILVPTDFSDTAENASEYAAELAKETGAELILFHAFHVPIPATDMPVLVVTPEEMEVETMRKLRKFSEPLRAKYPEVNIETAASAGFAVEEIVSEAKRTSADLIVMGIREMGPVDEMLIGSTTTDVLEKTPCPVLVIPKNVKFSKPDLIAFAADYKEIEDSSTLRVLKELAQVFHAKVDVFNVVKPNEEISVDKAVAGIKLEHQLEGIDHTHHFPVNDDVQEGLKDYVEQFHPSMLAMVHRKHGFFERLFVESATQKAVFHTHIPLLAMCA